MCVFLSLRMDKAKIKKRFDINNVEESFAKPVYVQSAFEFNKWPVISSEDPERLELMQWGLIPHWIDNDKDAAQIRSRTVNARIETISEKPSFRSVITTRRCMILAEGFFEFREFNKKIYPYYIQLRNGTPFSIAGVYDEWVSNESGEIIRSFSLLTTEANSLMAKVHNRQKRMPVILLPHQEKNWLAMVVEPKDIKEPYDEKEMEAWTVGEAISGRTQKRYSDEVLKKHLYPELGLLDSLNL